MTQERPSGDPNSDHFVSPKKIEKVRQRYQKAFSALHPEWNRSKIGEAVRIRTDEWLQDPGTTDISEQSWQLFDVDEKLLESFLVKVCKYPKKWFKLDEEGVRGSFPERREEEIREIIRREKKKLICRWAEGDKNISIRDMLSWG